MTSEHARIDTDVFYRESCDAGFVKREAIARNIAWETPTEWGDLQITINLSKPEKDPRAIAAAAEEAKAAAGGGAGAKTFVDAATGRVRPCPLCVTEEDVECGYARHIELRGEPWGLWYSPYAYYNEHCIAMSWVHRPMHIDRSAFEALADFSDLLPHYFIGSNADLPIVGGSILGHDHFQGGRHVFPMQQAPIDRSFELPAFPQVKCGIVRWPMSTLRFVSDDRAQLLDAACAVLDAWRIYDDPAVGIVSHDADGTRHNTVTPILRRQGGTAQGAYELDLALRCNVTSAEHPLGVFHPHEDLHHIKKENIGLIEVMGLAILPPRVRDPMADRNLTRDDVGRLFARVLEDAGVFKWDDAGQGAFDRFVQFLQKQ